MVRATKGEPVIVRNESILNLKSEFGDTYVIGYDEAYYYETPQNREPIEWYYVIPARYGSFSPHEGSTMAFFCTANRIKEKILRQYKGKATLYVEGDDESIILFDKGIFPEIAKIAKAKKRPGRKNLDEKELEQLLEAGKKHQFTGKSPQNTEQERVVNPLETIRDKQAQ